MSFSNFHNIKTICKTTAWIHAIGMTAAAFYTFCTIPGSVFWSLPNSPKPLAILPLLQAGIIIFLLKFPNKMIKLFLCVQLLMLTILLSLHYNFQDPIQRTAGLINIAIPIMLALRFLCGALDININLNLNTSNDTKEEAPSPEISTLTKKEKHILGIIHY